MKVASMLKCVKYPPVDITPKTRLYIPFNEGVGDVAKDYSQYNNHAALTDVEWSPDSFNGAGKFNGSSSFGDCGNDASLNLKDAFTMELWFTSQTIGWAPILIKDNAAAGKREWGIWFSPDRKVHIEVGDDGDSLPNISLGNTALALNTWNYLTFTYDGSSVRIYINGNLDTTPMAFAGPLFDTSQPVYIGKRTPEYFNGTIDEVRIYDRALSAAQIAADCYEMVRS